MSERAPGKSRRRFLADLLFLSGSVTAASMLAKTTLFQKAETPEPVEATPEPTPDTPPPGKVQIEPQTIDPLPGEMVLPSGDYVDPQIDIEECRPKTRGVMVMPKEHGSNGS